MYFSDVVVILYFLLNFIDSQALKPLLGILNLESWSWDLGLGILGLGLGNWAPEAGGTSWPAPGEPVWASSFTAALSYCIRTL